PPASLTLFPSSTLFRSGVNRRRAVTLRQCAAKINRRAQPRAEQPDDGAEVGPSRPGPRPRRHFSGGASGAAALARRPRGAAAVRSEEHTSELQSRENLV